MLIVKFTFLVQVFRQANVHLQQRVPWRDCTSTTRPERTPRVSFLTRVLQLLCNRFYDIEYLVNRSQSLRNWSLRRQNSFYGYTRERYGDNVAAACYILSLGGGIRFSGEREWFWENQLGKFRGDLSHFREIPVEEVDAKGTPITYDGLNNITILSSLRTLDLSNCPHVDDWCLSRLHALSESLEELSLSGCKKVSDKGLATLHHLKKLKKLELFDLSHISNPGLIRILLEEVLPECEILGIDYSDVLKGNSLEEINKQHS
ncbi:distal membrane-arm assembly complex protein 2 isoform X2 [Polypterus senegalus]|uniref:distal membrane-arm assembly complex protein 2 isoform X2 n=1 Tax=Polypterus senegalus TaxID=55291 RepID=UPI0019637FB4|nr:distal membrane-arm assembly complex protein 2 isoform X2 [Polypterus senegalus]